jgi:hypothetical protein
MTPGRKAAGWWAAADGRRGRRQRRRVHRSIVAEPNAAAPMAPCHTDGVAIIEIVIGATMRRVMLEALLPRWASQARNAATVAGVAGSGLRLGC